MKQCVPVHKNGMGMVGAGGMGKRNYGSKVSMFYVYSLV